MEYSDLIITLVILVFLLIAAIKLYHGKWSGLIAGYNTMPEKEQKKYNKKVLCRGMSYGMFGFAFGIILCIIGDITGIKIFFDVSVVLITADCLVLVFWSNLSRRVKNPDAEETDTETGVGVRRFEAKDLAQVMEIWRDGNLQAHPFIDPAWWNSHFDEVSDAILQAEVYVYELNGYIAGFAGVQDDYIAGIFVGQEYRSQGIGKLLLDTVKRKKSRLGLHVYEKNTEAVRFYIREGFTVEKRQTEHDTGAEELYMEWHVPGAESAENCGGY